MFAIKELNSTEDRLSYLEISKAKVDIEIVFSFPESIKRALF